MLWSYCSILSPDDYVSVYLSSFKPVQLHGTPDLPANSQETTIFISAVLTSVFAAALLTYFNVYMPKAR